MTSFKYIPPKMGLTPQGRLRPNGTMDIKSSPSFFNDIKRFGRKKTKARRFYGVDKGAYQFMKNFLISEFKAKSSSVPQRYEYNNLKLLRELYYKEKNPSIESEEKERLRKQKEAEESLERLKEIRRESRTAIEGLRNMNTLSREIRGWAGIFAGL